MGSNYKYYGKSNLYVYLRTKDSMLVTDPTFLESLSTFQTSILDKSQSLGVVSVNSMVRIGDTYSSMALTDYKAMYANPVSSGHLSLYKTLAYPLFLTDLKHNTIVTISLEHFRFSEKAKTSAKEVRQLLSSSFKDSNGQSYLYEYGVGGTPAAMIDLYSSLKQQLPIWISIMLISVFILLMLMTNSIVLPLKAVIMSVLSIGATLGLTVWLFFTNDYQVQRALDYLPTGYMDGSNAIFIFSVAFGLSVDYELFLIAAVQEEFKKTKDLKLSILRALNKTGGIITSAAIMLAVTTFAFIGSKVYFIKVIGVGIAIAVVLDATIVRALFVPASLLLLGEWNFYCPQALSKVIDYINVQEPDHEVGSLEFDNGEPIEGTRESTKPKQSDMSTSDV